LTNVKKKVADEIRGACNRASIGIEGLDIVIERPNDASFGDLSTNIAFLAAKRLRANPVELARRIIAELHFENDFIDSIEVAGPGFINFSFSRAFLAGQVAEINRIGASYGNSDTGGGRKVQVEFVSANPTGPLVVVSARSAAVGNALVNILRKAGYSADAEYYLNDAGGQIERLGRSLRARFAERMGEKVQFPEDGYPGGYLVDIAEGIPIEEGKRWYALEEAESVSIFGGYAIETITRSIERDLELFGVHFDNFFRESSLHEGGEVEKALGILTEKGYVYEKDGAKWFKSTEFGDEKDRVLVRSDGTPTYFLADAAYHLNKMERGYERVIDIWGPDHHGHIKRLEAASRVLGAAEDWLEVIIVQWVRLIEEGKQISMSKRGGEFVTLADLVRDVGSDAAKFFFLMRRINAHLDFNLTLARKESEENPVYYVQYAHARISSVISFAKDEGVDFPSDFGCVELLKEPEEIALMRNLVVFPQLIEEAAAAREPHRLTTYSQNLAASFHRFYHICRIVSSDRRLSEARLLLAEATRIVLAESLRIIGVSAPTRM